MFTFNKAYTEQAWVVYRRLHDRKHDFIHFLHQVYIADPQIPQDLYIYYTCFGCQRQWSIRASGVTTLVKKCEGSGEKKKLQEKAQQHPATVVSQASAPQKCCPHLNLWIPKCDVDSKVWWMWVSLHTTDAQLLDSIPMSRWCTNSSATISSMCSKTKTAHNRLTSRYDTESPATSRQAVCKDRQPWSPGCK